MRYTSDPFFSDSFPPRLGITFAKSENLEGRLRWRASGSGQGQIYFHRGSFSLDLGCLKGDFVSGRSADSVLSYEDSLPSLSLSFVVGTKITTRCLTSSTWLSVSACQAALGWVHTPSVEVPRDNEREKVAETAGARIKYGLLLTGSRRMAGRWME